MTPVAGEERWEVLELIGAYAAGELEGEEAREAEQLIFDRPDYRRLAESYARMLVMLSTLGDEPVEAPEAIASCAVRQAYLWALLRQAEQVVRELVEELAASSPSQLLQGRRVRRLGPSRP
jgi:anti-sigma-K factor RskA